MTNKLKKKNESIQVTPTEATAKKEAYIPFFTATSCMVVALLAVIIDNFVYRFGGELLSPMISQIFILLIPAYICILLIYPNKSTTFHLKNLGMARLRAEYIFFIIFATLFLISASLLLNVLFGGVYPISEGFTLLGTFTAGVGEYTVSYPYLIVVYAAIPAIVEELLFRGLIYSLLTKVSEGFAIIISSIISAAFTFTILGFPTALFCALAYCFIRVTTGTLQACMIVHFVFNIYAIFAQTNVAKYFVSTPNLLLLFIIIIAAFLLCSVLFLSESAKIYGRKAARIKEGIDKSELPQILPKKLFCEFKEVMRHRPTLVSAIIFLASFIAATVIGWLT